MLRLGKQPHFMSVDQNVLRVKIAATRKIGPLVSQIRGLVRTKNQPKSVMRSTAAKFAKAEMSIKSPKLIRSILDEMDFSGKDDTNVKLIEIYSNSTTLAKEALSRNYQITTAVNRVASTAQAELVSRYSPQFNVLYLAYTDSMFQLDFIGFEDKSRLHRKDIAWMDDVKTHNNLTMFGVIPPNRDRFISLLGSSMAYHIGPFSYGRINSYLVMPSYIFDYIKNPSGAPNSVDALLFNQFATIEKIRSIPASQLLFTSESNVDIDLPKYALFKIVPRNLEPSFQYLNILLDTLQLLGRAKVGDTVLDHIVSVGLVHLFSEQMKLEYDIPVAFLSSEKLTELINLKVDFENDLIKLRNQDLEEDIEQEDPEYGQNFYEDISFPKEISRFETEISRERQIQLNTHSVHKLVLGRYSTGGYDISELPVTQYRSLLSRCPFEESLACRLHPVLSSRGSVRGVDISVCSGVEVGNQAPEIKLGLARKFQRYGIIVDPYKNFYSLPNPCLFMEPPLPPLFYSHNETLLSWKIPGIIATQCISPENSRQKNEQDLTERLIEPWREEILPHEVVIKDLFLKDQSEPKIIKRKIKWNVLDVDLYRNFGRTAESSDVLLPELPEPTLRLKVGHFRGLAEERMAKSKFILPVERNLVKFMKTNDIECTVVSKTKVNPRTHPPKKVTIHYNTLPAFRQDLTALVNLGLTFHANTKIQIYRHVGEEEARSARLLAEARARNKSRRFPKKPVDIRYLSLPLIKAKSKYFKPLQWDWPQLQVFQWPKLTEENELLRHIVPVRLQFPIFPEVNGKDVQRAAWIPGIEVIKTGCCATFSESPEGVRKTFHCLPLWPPEDQCKRLNWKIPDIKVTKFGKRKTNKKSSSQISANKKKAISG